MRTRYHIRAGASRNKKQLQRSCYHGARVRGLLCLPRPGRHALDLLRGLPSASRASPGAPFRRSPAAPAAGAVARSPAQAAGAVVMRAGPIRAGSVRGHSVKPFSARFFDSSPCPKNARPRAQIRAGFFSARFYGRGLISWRVYIILPLPPKMAACAICRTASRNRRRTARGSAQPSRRLGGAAPCVPRRAIYFRADPRNRRRPGRAAFLALCGITRAKGPDYFSPEKFFIPRRGIIGSPEKIFKKGLDKSGAPSYDAIAIGNTESEPSGPRAARQRTGRNDRRPRAGPQTAGTRRNTTSHARRAQPASTLTTAHEAPPTRTG